MFVFLVLGLVLVALSVLVEHLLEVRESFEELGVFFQLTPNKTA